MEHRFENRPIPETRRGYLGMTTALQKLTVGGPCLYIPAPPGRDLQRHQNYVSNCTTYVQKRYGGKLTVRQFKDENAVGVWRIA